MILFISHILEENEGISSRIEYVIIIQKENMEQK